MRSRAERREERRERKELEDQKQAEQRDRDRERRALPRSPFVVLVVGVLLFLALFFLPKLFDRDADPSDHSDPTPGTSATSPAGRAGAGGGGPAVDHPNAPPNTREKTPLPQWKAPRVDPDDAESVMAAWLLTVNTSADHLDPSADGESLGSAEAADAVRNHLNTGILVEKGSAAVATKVTLGPSKSGVANTSIREVRAAAVNVTASDFGELTLHYEVTAMLGPEGWGVFAAQPGQQ